jgi:hypothetical protein
MIVSLENKKIFEINREVVLSLLNMYPEEGLCERKVFARALIENKIDINDLKLESDKVLIPWQFFLLNAVNYKIELHKIRELRKRKVSTKLLSKRKGVGGQTSRRIVDRILRLQNYVEENIDMDNNPFCSSLKSFHRNDIKDYFLNYFSIDLERLWSINSKAEAIEYLVKKIEQKGINICRGVLTHKILPHHMVVKNELYKNTSGFIVYDPKIPFIFLPGDISPLETDGRQAFTLIYLTLLIGLGNYNFVMESDLEAKYFSSKTNINDKEILRIASEILIPFQLEDEIDDSLDKYSVETFCKKYKVTPTAILVTLLIRRLIKIQKYKEIKASFANLKTTQTNSNRRGQKVESAVRKFCGKYAYDLLNQNIKSKKTSKVLAQHLIFGAASKSNFKRYCINLNL